MNKGLIAQVYLRKELLPMAVIHQGFYRQVVIFAFLLILLLVGGYAPGSVWLWLVPIALIQALLVVAAACSPLFGLPAARFSFPGADGDSVPAVYVRRVLGHQRHR